MGAQPVPVVGDVKQSLKDYAYGFCKLTFWIRGIHGPLIYMWSFNEESN